MPIVNVFVSFEYDKDSSLKNAFYKQAEEHLEGHSIGDCSLHESYPTERWKGMARNAIRQCDVVFVLVGQDTHNASGVQVETGIAESLRKPVIQVLSKTARQRNWTGIRHIEDRIPWKWARIRERLDTL